MQSHRGFIEFLPAVPDAWKTGSFRGMLARGNFEINLDWEKGKWKRAEILSRAGAQLRLKLGKGAAVLENGKKLKLKRDSSGIVELKTAKGKRYTVVNG